MIKNGWRKPTPGLMLAEKHAQAGEHLSIPKSKATTATKKVAAIIGLKAPDLLLLDTFAAFTKPQDWEKGRRPIVWVSNNFLMEQTGFSLSALRRHVRRLAELGLIWIKDSPNGKRYGHRDKDGVIVEAFGFDLAPLAARTAEFEALYLRVKEEREFCASLRNTVTVTRRVIRAKIERALESSLRGPWQQLKEEFAELLLGLPTRSTPSNKLIDIVDWFKAFKTRVEQAFEAAFDGSEEAEEKQSSCEAETGSNTDNLNNKMTPTGLTNDTHILITKQLYPVNGNINEKAKRDLADTEQTTRIETDQTNETDATSSFSRSGVGMQVDIATIMSSCPSFAEMAHGLHDYINDWREFVSVADKIRPMVEISPDAWQKAKISLGSIGAAAAIALITDKYSDGEVSSPGGYLRGLIAKSEAGELHLARSFYGRLNEKVTA